MNEKIINLPKFGMGAEVRSASFDEADNTIEVIWTTGAPVRRWFWRSERYYQEILEVTPASVRLERLNAGAPFLNTHSDGALSDVIGSVVPGSARVEGGKGYAKVKLSRADEDKAIVDKIRDGIIRNISVGYAIHKVVKTDADGDGADEEWRVVDWEPLEISAVPVPADAGSQIRKRQDGDQIPCEFVSDGVSEIRRRMEKRHAMTTGANEIEMQARAHQAAGRVSQSLLDALSVARIAVDVADDPVEAAEIAHATIDGDDEERGAAYIAAYMLASTSK